jgi:hypothetical protein
MHSPRHWALSGLLILQASLCLAGIGWGLPNSEANRFLFGSHPAWSGVQISELAGPTEDPSRGADVSSAVPVNRNTITVVNADDTDRARIVRRYRLMSYQPDEWNTLKALSEMKPGQGNFDPKLYQYGGLWVYPVGAMLKAASLMGGVTLKSDISYYLDHPQDFGRFYVVARLWSAIWALVGVVAIFALVKRIVGGWFFPAAAALCFIFMPVAVNMAHEAKPHLAGAALMLLAVLAASRYVERGTRRAWIAAGALCGAALGMVLSTLPVFLVLPGMVLLRRSTWPQKFRVAAGACAMGALVYLATNPYVPVNFIWHRTVLESNLGNSRAMYQPRITGQGLANAAYLIAAGTSPLLALAGLAGGLALGIRAVRVRKRDDPAETTRRATGLLLAIPALCVIGQSVLFATGKPGEFARFMIFADVFLAVEAIVAAATFLPAARIAPAVALLLALTAAIPGISYVRAFVRDSRTPTNRLVEAERLRKLSAGSRRTIAIYADPAPYCLPPVDLFQGPILLLPRNAGPADGIAAADLSVRAVDLPDEDHAWLRLWTATPISWADKSFEVRTRN